MLGICRMNSYREPINQTIIVPLVMAAKLIIEQSVWVGEAVSREGGADAFKLRICEKIAFYNLFNHYYYLALIRPMYG